LANTRSKRSAPAPLRLKPALVLHLGAPLSRRGGMAFTETWQAAGGEVVTTVESDARSGAEWRAQALQALNGAAVQVVFAAVPEMARGLRNGLPREWLLISTSQLNSMATNVAGRAGDLEGLAHHRNALQVSPDHPAVMGDSRSTQFSHLDYQRLYAGALMPIASRAAAARRTRFEIDGVTGRLKINLEVMCGLSAPPCWLRSRTTPWCPSRHLPVRLNVSAMPSPRQDQGRKPSIWPKRILRRPGCIWRRLMRISKWVKSIW